MKEIKEKINRRNSANISIFSETVYCPVEYMALTPHPALVR